MTEKPQPKEFRPMNGPLAPHQIAFWRALLAPFPDECLSVTKRGGRELTYIDKRSISNRLDSVCGPHNWYPSYTETSRGLMCHLTIVCPMEDPGTWVAITKTDGAGPEEMGSENKQTHEWECDVDNDVKSNFTNAFRRAAQDAWGIGRYLYRKGIPDFLDPNASSSSSRTPPSGDGPKPTGTSGPNPGTPAATPAPAASKPQPAAAPPREGQAYDNFRIPKPGPSVFRWAKEMETTFQTKILDGMTEDGIKIAGTKVAKDWNAEQVEEICMMAIRFIATLPTYQGQFNHLLTPADRAVDAAASSLPPPLTTDQAAALVASPADLKLARKELAAKLTALIERESGEPATKERLLSALGVVSSVSKTYRGVLGEVCEGLNACDDGLWIANMIATVDAKIAASSAPAADDDVDF